MSAIYCPVCQRIIAPANLAEVESGENDAFIYVHDDIVHDDDDDMLALDRGIQ